MSELGLAVIFCVLQVTLLAAVVALCYLCSRRSRPGFRSSIASTGVFLVLVLSLLCLSPYPNWMGGGVRGKTESVQSESGLFDRLVLTGQPLQVPSRSEVAAEHGMGEGEPRVVSTTLEPIRTPGPRQVSAVGDARSVKSSDDAEGRAAPYRSRLSVVAHELQRGSGWIVEFRDWLATRYRGVKWGWLAGVMLLAGISWNLLRFVVGWWQLRRFRQRSTPVNSPELAECLDIVQAALSLRTPVELRQTSEMTSPATIGWWRPVVILPVDWEEWNPDERLGVLAHELAHIRRHDFLTGLFSQLVLALHFYHPLISWLVHRLHLEQELAADAAAVRVLGGQKPYLKMLAGMALKDHTSSLPVAARTFFPQSGTLMARVELLRGHKVEAGDGSFSWRTSVRGALVVLGLVVAGLRPLSGSVESRSEAVPLTSAFVPETSAGCLVWRPKRIPEGHPLASLLFDPARGWSTELRDGLGQISLFWLEMKGGGGEDSNSPSPDGVVLNFDSSMTRDAVFDHLVRHPEQNLGLLMLAGQPASRGIMRKAGSRDLLLCRDETVFMVSLLSSSATPSAAWSASWERQGLGDVAVGFRPGLASRFRLAGGSYTAVLEDLVAQLADWSATGEFGLASVDLRRNRCDLEMIPGSGATSSDLLAAVENLRHNWARRGEGASPPNGGDHLEFDPVQGNEWCRNLLENCRVEKLSNRLRIDAPLSALLGIGLRMGSGPDESKSFAQIWSDHESSRLTLALGLMRSALLAYRSEHGTFPPPALRRDANSPPYSWRVALLPYLGRQDLFDQYRLDLPWNSPENLQLLSQIPDVYRSFGSFSSSTPFRHGAALNASTAEHLLSDWTEAESVALFGATVVSIPWTSPLDEHWEEVPVSRVSGAVGGVLAVLQTGDLEQRVGSTLVDVQSSTDVSVP